VTEKALSQQKTGYGEKPCDGSCQEIDAEVISASKKRQGRIKRKQKWTTKVSKHFSF
jgi:hypothetical protein